GSLEQYLYLRCSLTELDAKRVVRQLLEGLSYLHKSGIVHCDLKPANILFSDIDYGVNATTDSGKSVPRAQHTGTEGFVAPEVLKSKPYGKAADTWSTGCMLYQMLTGRMPWMPSRACLHRPLSTTGPSWKNISDRAKSLVEDLLNTDQNLRADVEQAMHHPWFEDF
ncbi:unnamed protein product, partial [Ascophyllum nodosum]